MVICTFTDDRLSILFFFQAEDGIRDLYVTGVQTCALPIYRLRAIRACSVWPGRLLPILIAASIPTRSVVLSAPISAFNRSEERRVGKECSSRWSRYQ